MVAIACKSLSEGQIETKQTDTTKKKDAFSAANNGTSNGESRAKDTPTTSPTKAIHHDSPDQVHVDSLKQIKTNKKK